MKKKIFMFLFCVLVMMSALTAFCTVLSNSQTVFAAEVTDSGSFGKLKGSLDSAGELRIYGTGEVPGFGENPPWYYRNERIKSLVIEDSITSISNYNSTI